MIKASVAILCLLSSVVCSAQSPAKAKYRFRGTTILPDSIATPGAVATSDTAVVCHRSTKSVRAVPNARKDSVFSLYGVRTHPTGAYEIDHLISLELGGSNALQNLWPEPALPKPGFHQKDVLENWLHKQVCTGKVSLKTAQAAIASDWYDVYLEMTK